MSIFKKIIGVKKNDLVFGFVQNFGPSKFHFCLGKQQKTVKQVRHRK